MKWSERTHWLSKGLRSILTHMFKSLWWILMGNNHARPVLQSGTAKASDLLQGQRGLFLADEIIAHQMALWQMFGINRPRQTSAGEHWIITPRPTFSIHRLLTGQLWGLESAPRSDSQQPPPLPHKKMGAGKKKKSSAASLDYKGPFEKAPAAVIQHCSSLFLLKGHAGEKGWLENDELFNRDV